MKTNVFKDLSLSLMFGISISLSVFMGSCSNTVDEILTEDNRLRLQEQELLTEAEDDDNDYLLPDGDYSFTFEGEKYTYTLEDGKVVCDFKTQNILNYLQHFGEKLITLCRDNQIEYFTSEETYRKKYIIPRIDDDPYRTVDLGVYRNKNYWGSRKHFYLDTRNGDTKTNTGISWGISSFKANVTYLTIPLRNSVFIDFYDQYNLTGRMLVYNEEDHVYVKNLKDVPLFPGSSENWNDRIKSLRLY